MFSSYFDSSTQSNRRKSLMAVAGLLSSVNKWDYYFVPAWRQHLRKYELDYLHIKELHAFRGRYYRFKDNRLLRDQFMSESIETILKFASRSIGRMLGKQEYEIANSRWKLKESRINPFCLCSISCVIASEDYAARYGDKVECIFHQGDKGFGKVQELARTFTNEPIQRQNKGYRGLVQLQAADLIAYELALERFRNDGAVLQWWRKSFQSLVRIESDWRILTQKDVDDLCSRFGVSGR